MFCRKCGLQNDESAYKCMRCGEVLQHLAATPPMVIPNYLVQAILVTVFCCLPFGIPAIVFAAQVNSKVAAGDIQGALHSSKNAKMWAWIAFGIGLAWVIVYALYMVLMIMAAAANAHHG